MEAIRTKAISQFIDHTYPAIEKATKPSRGHSIGERNMESYFHLEHISIKRSYTLGKCFIVSEARITVQHLLDSIFMLYLMLLYSLYLTILS